MDLRHIPVSKQSEKRFLFEDFSNFQNTFVLLCRKKFKGLCLLKLGKLKTDMNWRQFSCSLK
jgi:hypothetical protein